MKHTKLHLARGLFSLALIQVLIGCGGGGTSASGSSPNNPTNTSGTGGTVNSALAGTTWKYTNSEWKYYSAHIKDYWTYNYTFYFSASGTGTLNLSSTDTSYIYNVITDEWQIKNYDSAPTYEFNYAATSSSTIGLTSFRILNAGVAGTTHSLSGYNGSSFTADWMSKSFLHN